MAKSLRTRISCKKADSKNDSPLFSASTLTGGWHETGLLFEAFFRSGVFGWPAAGGSRLVSQAGWASN